MELEKKYLKEIITRFEFPRIYESLEKLKNLSVLVIGDTIIDHYVFVGLKGRAVKDPILSTEYKNHEIYAGGILAITNHLSTFVKNIKLVTLIGDLNSHLDFINQSVKNNTELKTFVKENSPTTVKKRMLDYYRNNKLFKIEYINEVPINQKLTDEITNYLDEEIPKYDLVIVGDFGHGFINDIIRRKLEEKSKFLAINTQSNSANMGYNYFSLYRKFNFLCINDEELRLPLSMRFDDIAEVVNQSKNIFSLDNFIVTIGKNGSVFVKDGKMFQAPIITTSVKDTVGAGDALFAIASLLNYIKIDNELIPFLANCAGGIAANITGNKESVTKEKLLNFIERLYENGLE